MKTLSLLRFSVVLAGTLFIVIPASAQRKLPKRIRHATRMQQEIAWQKAQHLAREADQASRLASKIEYVVEHASNSPLTVAPKGNSAKTRLPRPPENLVSSLIEEDLTRQGNHILNTLHHIWRLQDRYGNHNLFSIFIRQYYSLNFGVVSPHLQTLFNKLGALENRDLELRVTKRLRYLAQNKDLLAQALLEDDIAKLPTKAFRVRYLTDIGQLSAENFREENLVLSIERRMSPNPDKDFPIRHVSGHALVPIHQDAYSVYGFNAPLDQITSLYRFLLNGKKKGQQMTVIFDEKGKSMAIFNHDKSLWLRISPHEYSSPQRLHIHLNELRPVTFTNTYGVEKQERVNFNLSVPLSVPEDLPSYGVQDFLYKKLIANPVKFFKGDDHVKVEYRPIF